MHYPYDAVFKDLINNCAFVVDFLENYLIPSYLPFLTTEDKYYCHQWDLPLAFLTWFPQTLHDSAYRRIKALTAVW